uniref:F-box domain-containing protein n=1 Tax=Tetradesmus obliquus TaxID=3088 RepID=A0A383WCI2_TETOB|eukprot:jgi/Sobl393_1/5793/SZX75337.1
MQQVLGRLDANRDVAAADMVCKAWRALKTPYPALRKYDTINVSTLNWIKANRNRVMSFAFNLSSKKAVQRSTIGSELLLLGLGSCPALSSLTINELQQLPQSITQLSKLPHLLVASCQSLFYSLPEQELSGLQSLTLLEFRACSTSYGCRLPAGLSELTSLQVLSTSRYRLPPALPASNSFTHICIEESHEPLPGQLWRQPLLVQLRLHKVYELKEIPDTLELPNLQELCIDSCWSLASLPANLWQALGGSLRKLQLMRLSKLAALPPGMTHTAGCARATARHPASCASIPAGAWPPCQPPWQAIGGSLRKLQLMRLTKLAALPPGMASLQQLRYLEVDGCELLAELPGCLVGCTQLRQLVLQSCKALAALPAGLEAMPSLKQATI